MRILFIDPDEYYHHKFTEYFRLLGEVSGEKNASDALKRISQDPPDMIITELVLGDEPGYSFIKKVRKVLPAGDLPIIVFSEVSGREDLEASLEMGVNAYFVKGKNTLRDIYDLAATYKAE